MKFKPDYNNYRESPWILITLPESRRMEQSNHNNGMNNNNKDNRKNRMSFGIHHLVAKNNALNSATWPRPKMKKSKSRCTSNDEDDRPKTATLEHPKILDIAFLGKIDMTSLSKKSLMSIANLCILPVKQEAKRNGGCLNGGRGGKTRRYTPNRSPSPRVKKAIRFLSSDKETNSENEEVRSQVIQTPRKTTKHNKIPVKTRGSISSEKSIDSDDKEVKKTVSRGTLRSKTVDEVLVGNSNIPVPCMTCGRSDQPERLHSHPSIPRSILKTPVVVTPRSDVVKSSVRKPVPIRYRSETRKQEEVSVKTPEKRESVTRIPEMRRKERTPEPEIRKKEVVVERNLEPEIRRRDILIRTPDPEIKRKDILIRTPEPTLRRQDVVIRSPEPENRRKDSVVQTPEPRIRKKEEVVIRTPEPEFKRKEVGVRTPEPELRRKEVLVRTPEPELRRKEIVVRTPEPRLKKKEEGEDMQHKGNTRQGPRTLMCYICGRSFGTASFPLHEPQCLQRWHRENALLAPNLQRKPPQKPDSPLTSEEWNRLAFEASQSQLISCVNCGRTFNPDRLEVHQRSCRPGAKRINNTTQSQDESTSSEAEEGGGGGGVGSCGGGSSVVRGGGGGGGLPPAVYCYICGRMFGTKSIAIHEPKCMEKWRVENEQLPAHQRRPEPIKPEPVKSVQHKPDIPLPQHPAPSAPSKDAQPPENPRRRIPAVPCYLCGRQFGTTSINIHEPQCLKKWRIENEKLPKSKQRKEPEKPDIVYTASGQIDFQGTMDAIWETHLTQLVPCKHCGRTFNPDRVDVHERSCKGPSH